MSSISGTRPMDCSRPRPPGRGWPTSMTPAAASPAASSTLASPTSTVTEPAGCSVSTRVASWLRQPAPARRRKHVRRDGARRCGTLPGRERVGRRRQRDARDARVRRERHGVAAWLAAPAPSGALEFVSAGATFASRVWRSPRPRCSTTCSRSPAPRRARARMARTSRRAGGARGRARLLAARRPRRRAGRRHRGRDRRPAAPEAVVEGGRRGDRSGGARGRARGVEAANRKAAEEGHDGVRLGEEEVDGRRYLTLSSAAGTELATMTFVDGYLIVAPSRALVLEAIAHKAAGTTLTASSAFQELLPSDAETDFSGLLWQNLGGSAGRSRDLGRSARGPRPRAARGDDPGPRPDAGARLRRRRRGALRGARRIGSARVLVREAVGGRRRNSRATRRRRPRVRCRGFCDELASELDPFMEHRNSRVEESVKSFE